MPAQPIGQHIRFRLTNDRVIIDHPAKRARAARILLRLGRDYELLAFSIADTHAHLEVACCRAAAGELARRAQIALKTALSLPVPFVPAHFEPIWTQRHLYNALRYILNQNVHHRLQGDPLAEASSLPDLLGLRVAGGYYLEINLRRWLPRCRWREFLPILKA